MRSSLQLRGGRIGALCKLRLKPTGPDKLFMRSSQGTAVLLRFKPLLQKFGVRTCLVFEARLLARRNRAGICASEEGASASLPQPDSVPGQKHHSIRQLILLGRCYRPRDQGDGYGEGQKCKKNKQKKR